MKTNYAGHDRQYQKRRAAGKPGWADDDVIAENSAILADVFQSPHFPRKGRLLEMGCGAGDMTLGLAALGYAVSGVDISAVAVEWARDKARERGLSADFRVGSVLDLADYADDSFDVVLDGHCLHCIIGADRADFLASARRVLKPGGVLHINTMCGDHLANRFPEQFDPESRCQIINGVALRYTGHAEDIVAEVQAAGLEIIQSKVVLSVSDNASDMLLIDACQAE